MKKNLRFKGISAMRYPIQENAKRKPTTREQLQWSVVLNMILFNN